MPTRVHKPQRDHTATPRRAVSARHVQPWPASRGGLERSNVPGMFVPRAGLYGRAQGNEFAQEEAEHARDAQPH
jgi:hypothetical protein